MIHDWADYWMAPVANEFRSLQFLVAAFVPIALVEALANEENQ